MPINVNIGKPSQVIPGLYTGNSFVDRNYAEIVDRVPGKRGGYYFAQSIPWMMRLNYPSKWLPIYDRYSLYQFDPRLNFQQFITKQYFEWFPWSGRQYPMPVLVNPNAA